MLRNDRRVGRRSGAAAVSASGQTSPYATLQSRQQRSASEAAQRRGSEPTSDHKQMIPRPSVFVNRKKNTITAGVATAMTEAKREFQVAGGTGARVRETELVAIVDVAGR